MVAPVIDEVLFAIINGMVLALFFLGFRMHFFGLFAGLLDFLFYSWLVSYNVVLQNAAGTPIMNFGIVTLQPGQGWIGPIMAIIGIIAAMVYVKT